MSIFVNIISELYSFFLSPGITSVPYRASYKLLHLALAAFRAYLALSTGTTSCGPAIDEISSSTFDVVILKFSLSALM